MAANQVLAYHRVAPRVYNLTGLRTGSVRDQMLRAIMLTEAIYHDTDELKGSSPEPDDGILVIGGGVAGVSCALIASKLNINVTILEKNGILFSTLLNANNRRIDPFEYDWPQPPVAVGTTFPRHLRFPLLYTGGTAAQVAHDWELQFKDWLRLRNPGIGSPGHVEVLWNTKAESYSYAIAIDPDSTDLIGVSDKRTSGSTVRKYRALIICAGVGGERTYDDASVPAYQYVGPGFWTFPDQLETADFGLPPSGGTPRHILISGGGDGAMQDLQRAATGKFGMDLLTELKTALNLPDALEKEFARLLIADDRAKRAYAWKGDSGPRKALDGVMNEWHREFGLAVSAIFQAYATANSMTDLSGNPDEAKAQRDLAGKLLRSEILAGAKISWVFAESNPGYAYALNRFLSDLIVKLLRAKSNHRVYRVQTKILNIAAVTSAPHTCGSALGCYGHIHDVTFSNTKNPEPFDIIIIRHGIIPGEIAGLPFKAPVPEQLAPYDIPD
ncbi:hypothetical protein ABH945_006997 [Paraburkholderia sp. GAS333]|uniref:hypothetical protein n=1 Tax=Paraburkholderia sp. GAS333 TaxID=3156279 RepID=UPI003D20D200